MRNKVLLILTFTAAVTFGTAALAKDYIITLKDHKFIPSRFSVPAGEKVKITLKNEQTSTAEFESATLGREKIVEAGSTIEIYIGPLDPGSYAFYDDYHRDTKGIITVK